MKLIINFLRISLRMSWYGWGLYGLCIIILISHTFYVVKTHQYPEQDEHAYLDMAVKFHGILQNTSVDSISQIINVNRTRQPLYGVFLAIPLLLFGLDHTYKIALWMNYFLYITTIIGIYFLGKEFLSKRASFLAAFIYAFYGFPLFYLHFTYSETATTTFIVLSLLFLAKSKNFSVIKYSVLFSIFFALGNLIRWVVPIFTAGPIMLSFFIALVQVVRRKGKKAKNIIISLIVVFAIGVLPVLFLFYIPNFSFFSQYIISQQQAAPEWMTQWFGAEYSQAFSIHSMKFYFNILSQQTVFFFGLFVIGVIYSLYRRQKYLFFLTGFFVSYAVFTFGGVLKFDRYIVPIYPMMALLSAVVFDEIKNRKVNSLLVILTIIIGSLNFLGGTWGVGPMKFSITGNKYTVPHSILLPMPIGHPRRVWLAPISWPPREEELNAELVINTIEQDFEQKSRPPALLITFDYHPFNNAMYSIIVYHKRYLLKSPDLNISHIGKNDYYRLFKGIKTADYILIKDSKPIDKYTIDLEDMHIIKQFNKALLLPNGKLPSAFVPIKTIPIPLDKTNVTIYKKIRSVTKQEMNEFAELFVVLNPQEEEIIRKAVLKVNMWNDIQNQ